MKYIFNAEHLTLPTPLGSWKSMTSNQWKQDWDYFINEDGQFLYKNMGKSTWHRYLIKPNLRRTFHKEFLVLQEDPIDIKARVSVIESTHSIRITSTSHISQVPPSPTIAISFDEIHLYKPKLGWFMRNLTSSESTGNLLAHLIQGTAVGVSDGSYYESHDIGSCAWIISTPDGKEWISGGGLIPGIDEDQSAYRSELGGLLGITIFLHAIQLPPNTEPSILIACDGLSALNKIKINANQRKCKYKHIDFISIMHDLWQQSKFLPTTKHVYGHQDVTGRELSLLELLNCKMDLKAKEIALTHIQHPTNQPNPPPTILGLGSIYCNGNIISSKIQQSLYKTITKNSFINWFSDKTHLPTNLLQQSINWPSFHQARKNATLSRKIFITKWISNFTASGEYMVRNKMRKDSSCPICKSAVEDLPHILTCPSTATQGLHKILLADLHTWLTSSRTLKSITTFIHSGLKHWLSNPTTFWRPNFTNFLQDSEYTFPISHQLQIG